MADITDKSGMDNGPRTSNARQLAWFIGLYLAGLLAVALVAWFFRTLLGMLH